MVSARVGQATLRSSPRTSRRNCAGVVRASLGRGGAGVAGRLRAWGSPAPSNEPCRWSIRFCCRFIAMDVDGSFEWEVQGRRDSNPQPAVLETAALPVELLPLEL